MPTANDALVYTKQNGLRPPWAIFPLRGKFPAIKGGHGCKDATTDPKIINGWWAANPAANIGLATGEVNGILVLDIDRNHEDGVDGAETLRELEQELGKLPDTVEVLTPNGGRHIYFKYPAGYDISIHKSQQGDRWPGIDVRGNGGYVAAPPSVIRCTDRKTRAYEWEATSYPNDHALADLPAPWLEWVNRLCGRFKLPDAKTVKPGSRNDTLFSYACQLRAGGADDRSLREKIAEYNKKTPAPLDDREVARIVQSALRYTPNAPSTQPGTPAAEPARKLRPRMTRAIVADTISELGFAVRYNLIANSYEIDGRTPAGRASNQDDLCTLLHDTLADEYRGTSLEIIAAYMTFEAREHSYNPVLDLLRATKWDGTNRLPQLYDLVGIAPSDLLSQALWYKWLLQSVALLFNGGEKSFGADGCLVLNGPQGTGKTSLFKHLALRDEWFGEGLSLDDRDKDTMRRVLGCWIAELGEVESTLKSDINKLKAFVSNSEDAYRLPYAKSDIVSPRHTSLCATCNSDRYLIDTTGNRRWWSVPLTRTIPRAEMLQLDALQLWAQIFALVEPMNQTERGNCFRLSEAEQAELAVRNGEYEKPSKGQNEVEDILEKADRDGLPTREVTISEFKEAWPVLRPYTVNQIGAALKRCSVTITHKRRGNVADLPIPSPGWAS